MKVQSESSLRTSLIQSFKDNKSPLEASFSFQDFFLFLINSLTTGASLEELSHLKGINPEGELLLTNKGNALRLSFLRNLSTPNDKGPLSKGDPSQKDNLINPLWNLFLNFLLYATSEPTENLEVKSNHDFVSDTLLPFDRISFKEGEKIYPIIREDLSALFESTLSDIKEEEFPQLLRALEKGIEERFSLIKAPSQEANNFLEEAKGAFIRILEREFNKFFNQSLSEANPLNPPSPTDPKYNLLKTDLTKEDTSLAKALTDTSDLTQTDPHPLKGVSKSFYALPENLRKEIREEIVKFAYNNQNDKGNEPYISKEIFLSAKKTILSKVFPEESPYESPQNALENFPPYKEVPPLNTYKLHLGSEIARGNSLSETHTSRAEAGLRLENFAEVIKNFTIELKPSGEKRAEFELEPPELGKLELKVKVKEGEVEILVRVEKAETLSLLRNELTQIRNDLEALGLKLKDLQLSLGFSGEGNPFAERGEGDKRGLNREKAGKLWIEKKEEEPSFFPKGRLYKIV